MPVRRHAVLALAVLAALLVPATGQAQGRPQPYKVKIAVSATSTIVGTAVTVSGTVKAKAAKKKVKLQEQVGATWQTVVSTTLSKKSAYSISYTPTAPGTHHLRVQKGAGDGHPKGVSKTATLTVSSAPGGGTPAGSIPSSGSGGAGLAAGFGHICVIVGGGAVKCWGLNNNGQLGNGTTNGGNANPTPASVQGLTGVTALGAGYATSCAVVGTGGQVSCWGDNAYGQLGSGASGPDSSIPVVVPGVSNAVAVDVGQWHVCALLATGTVLCWGKNTSYVLGSAAVPADAFSGPTPVAGVTTATALSVARTASCALLSDHTLTCWGSNAGGGLGDGTHTPRTTPVSPIGINDATAVGSGSSDFHSCAVTSGAVRCWGSNSGGATGTPAPPDEVDTPALVPGVSGATAVAVGTSHGCAIVAGGAMTCWGDNNSGQQGTGAGPYTINQPPAAVTGLTGAVIASAGFQSTCALLASGEVRCWGSNFYGELGNGDSSHGTSSSPVAVINVP